MFTSEFSLKVVEGDQIVDVHIQPNGPIYLTFSTYQDLLHKLYTIYVNAGYGIENRFLMIETITGIVIHRYNYQDLSDLRFNSCTLLSNPPLPSGGMGE